LSLLEHPGASESILVTQKKQPAFGSQLNHLERAKSQRIITLAEFEKGRGQIADFSA
jgi:hypothetical protein